DVMPGLIARAPGLIPIASAADRRADIARSLADSTGVLGPVAKLGDLDLRQWDRDQFSPRLADHFPVGNVFAQIGLDLAPNDLLEPVSVSLDFTDHSDRSSPMALEE